MIDDGGWMVIITDVRYRDPENETDPRCRVLHGPFSTRAYAERIAYALARGGYLQPYSQMTIAAKAAQ